MSKIFVFFLAMNCISAFSQKAEPVLFSELYFDFGNIAETGGAVEHVFTFINNSGLPLQLKSVDASCGCTTPEWTTEIIRPGNSGKIKAIFNPAGRPGYFNKSINVLTDPELGPITLQISGNVTNGKKYTIENLEYTTGKLSTHASSFNMGKAYINTEPAKRNFEIQNTGAQVLRIYKADTPEWIKLTYPSTLKPGERAIIKIEYNGKKRNRFGFQSEQVVLYTSDSSEPEKHYSVLVTLEEFFPESSPEEQLKKPRLSLSASEINFGSVADSVIYKEVMLKNNGKETLNIRALIPNCICLDAQVSNKNIEAGKSAKLNIRFLPGSRTGRQNKSIMIYSNDPANPVQRITLNGIITEN
jgi:hypothetical protein